MSSRFLPCAAECVVVPFNDREKFVRRWTGRRRGRSHSLLDSWTCSSWVQSRGSRTALPSIVATEPIRPAVTYNKAGWTEAVCQSEIQIRFRRLPKKKEFRRYSVSLKIQPGDRNHTVIWTGNAYCKELLTLKGSKMSENTQEYPSAKGEFPRKDKLGGWPPFRS